MPSTLDHEVTLLAAGTGEVLDVFGARMIVKAEPRAQGFFLGKHLVPPGYAVPPHIHAEDGETFYILEGELTLFDGIRDHRVGPGATARLPAGVKHAFRNDTEQMVRFLVMAHPGQQSLAMFRHFHAAGDAGKLEPNDIVAICGQHGVSIR